MAEGKTRKKGGGVISGQKRPTLEGALAVSFSGCDKKIDFAQKQPLSCLSSAVERSTMRMLPNLFPSNPILIGRQPFSSTRVRKSHGRQEINSNLGIIGA